MPTLRISSDGGNIDSRRFTLEFISGDESLTATANITRPFLPEEQESVRWYLEEYRNFPFEPASTIARQTASRLREAGEALFADLFGQTPESEAVWALMDGQIEFVRIEVEDDVSQFSVPWELLWSPLDIVPLSCRVSSFSRSGGASFAGITTRKDSVVRVLLVISRPAGNRDVPFRSVAARLLESVGDDTRFHFTILRPPTFVALQQALKSALDRGQPYAVVHFDGHGVYEDRMAILENRPEKKRRGYLVFEYPNASDRPEYINGAMMTAVLLMGQVPILILNACRSALSELTEHQIANRRPLGSLADEILRAGQPAVVAMQYNIDVETAARFVAELYRGLSHQLSLSQAAAAGRRAIFDESRSRHSSSSVRVEDWLVPVVFETAPLKLSIHELPESAPTPSVLVPASVYRTESIGNDDTVMALEKAFQKVPVVVLTGPIGSGKTALARDFAAWDVRTRGESSSAKIFDMGGAQGLDVIANAYEKERSSLDECKDLADPISFWRAQGVRLYVFDNLGSGSSFERAALEELLQALAANGCSALLVTRAVSYPLEVEHVVVEISPLGMSDSLLVAHNALPGRGEDKPEDWLELLRFAQGNPGAILALVSGLKGRLPADINARLKAAGNEPVGLAPELLTLLLSEFDEDDLDCLSLIALFEGAISTKTLRLLASARSESGPSRENADGIFDRLSELGLARPLDISYYRTHPGLPGLFHLEFMKRYTGERREQIRAARITFFSAVSAVFFRYGENGERSSYEIAKQTLALLEPTIWRVLQDAKDHERWADVRNIAAALRRSLSQDGRKLQWRRLAHDLELLTTDPAIDKPLPGREPIWDFLLSDRIERLIKLHLLSDAAWLQKQSLDRARVELSKLTGSNASFFAIEVVLDHLMRMGAILMEQGDAGASSFYLEALGIAQSQRAQLQEQRIASRLARLYLSPKFVDLQQVTYWLAYATELCPTHDRIGQAQIRFIEGLLSYTRYKDNDAAVNERAKQIKRASECFSDVLSSLLPPERSDERSECEVALARATFERWRYLPKVMQQVQLAIAWYDADENLYRASLVRLDASRMLSSEERSRAYFYAREAARGFADLAPYAEAELLEATVVSDDLERSGQYQGGKLEH